MSSPAAALSYSIAATESLLVVTFKGVATRNCGETVERCGGEIISSHARFVVFLMKDVTQIERPFIPNFAKLQKQVRDAKKELRICALKPELKALLTDLVALRGSEVKADLTEALKSFSSYSKV